jgi:hypothetical protein
MQIMRLQGGQLRSTRKRFKTNSSFQVTHFG